VTTVQPATPTDPGFVLVSCIVDAGTPIDVYEVTLTVAGGYYQGNDTSVLTVYDPTAGGSNGGGTISDEVSGARADVGLQRGLPEERQAGPGQVPLRVPRR
jgi:hypothetical protein